jgi:hypothetical protein
MHATLYPFLNQKNPPAKNYQKLQHIFRNVDPDVQATAVQELTEIVEEIRCMTWLPRLDALIEETMHAGGTPPRAQPLPDTINVPARRPPPMRDDDPSPSAEESRTTV